MKPAIASRERMRKRSAIGANEIPDVSGSIREIERYLKRGAVVIAEQKFGVECDAPDDAAESTN